MQLYISIPLSPMSIPNPDAQMVKLFAHAGLYSGISWRFMDALLGALLVSLSAQIDLFYPQHKSPWKTIMNVTRHEDY